MCTRYISPETREIEAYWHIRARTRRDPFQSARDLFPLATGPFVRNSADDGLRELAWGQWGMIPSDSETRIPISRSSGPGDKPKRLSTVNARTESVNSRPNFSGAWRAGQGGQHDDALASTPISAVQGRLPSEFGLDS